MSITTSPPAIASVVDCHAVWTALATRCRDEGIDLAQGSLPFAVVTGRLSVSFLTPAVIDQPLELHPEARTLIQPKAEGEIAFVLNTTEGKQAIADSFAIRAAALRYKVPHTTTLAGARATCLALQAGTDIRVESLHSLHTELT